MHNYLLLSKKHYYFLTENKLFATIKDYYFVDKIKLNSSKIIKNACEKDIYMYYIGLRIQV